MEDTAKLIEHNFKHHAPDAEAISLHETTRDNCRKLAHFIRAYIPESREQSLAMTKLEECMMWANAAIARN